MPTPTIHASIFPDGELVAERHPDSAAAHQYWVRFGTVAIHMSEEQAEGLLFNLGRALYGVGETSPIDGR